jgi:hypothetical protein
MATQGGRRRRSLRGRLWPNVSATAFWPQATEAGWVLFPRVMPLVLDLLSNKKLSGSMDLSRTYVGLWCNAYDGIVEIHNEVDFAAVAGLRTARGLRSWRDRVKKLSELGFIVHTTHQVQQIGVVGILRPYDAVAKLRKKGLVPDDWWNTYQYRLSMSGALDSDSVNDVADEPLDGIAEWETDEPQPQQTKRSKKGEKVPF